MSDKDLSKNKKNGAKKNAENLPDPSPDFTAESSVNPEEKPGPPSQASHDPPLETSEGAGKSQSRQQVQPMSESEERTWGMLAHLSVLLNLFTGFFGGIGAIIIYFLYKDRSRFVAYHAMQSFIFQSITWIGAGVIGGIFIAIGSILGVLIIPLLCLIPGFLILLLAPASVIYGIIGGIQVNNGEDFRYWQVGDWVRDILEPEQIQ